VSLYELPANLPVPVDDGACDHLLGKMLPQLTLESSQGPVSLRALSMDRLVLYVYPRAGRPDRPVGPDWDAIPGARGCTPQSCGFRDHFAVLQGLGVAQLYGLSIQGTAYQREAVERLHLPFAILSDEALELTRALRLPTFTVAGMMLLKRMACIIDDGAITKVFYPVFPPDQSAEQVVAWLKSR
jgi:peroxiredoxin